VVLGLIPARAGSKGLPGKNLRPLAGRPLIVRTAEVARASGVIDRLVLSTDSAEIADLARGAGIEVPFLRPPDLAADDTPMFPVVRHAIDRVLAGGSTPDVIVLLQPTSPLRIWIDCPVAGEPPRANKPQAPAAAIDTLKVRIGLVPPIIRPVTTTRAISVLPSTTTSCTA